MEINYLTYIFLFFAGLFKGIMDLISFRLYYSIFSDITFFNPKKSWVYKWKNNNPLNGERFFGSSTFLVGITDGWHLAQWFSIKFLFLSILFYNKQDNYFYMMIDFFLLFSYYVGFWVSYESSLFKKSLWGKLMK